MTTVLIVTASLLAASAALVLVRMVKGPSLLDRTLALDVTVSIAISGLGLAAVYFSSNVSLPALAVLSLFGFTGSVAVARYALRSGADAETAGADPERAGADPEHAGTDGRPDGGGTR